MLDGTSSGAAEEPHTTESEPKRPSSQGTAVGAGAEEGTTATELVAVAVTAAEAVDLVGEPVGVVLAVVEAATMKPEGGSAPTMAATHTKGGVMSTTAGREVKVLAAPDRARSLLVVRLCDKTWNAGNTAPGTALPVALDYYDVADASAARPWLSIALPRSSGAGGNACTLSHGATGASSLTWFWDTEGLPSTAGDGSAVVLPCHTSPAGSQSIALLADAKTIAILRRDGSVDTSIRFTGFNGVRGTATGLRTAVTSNTREFWLAGIADTNYGVRYLANPRNTSTTRVHGAVVRGDGSYQPATVDVRGLTLWGNQAYLTSAYVTEPNRNMPATSSVYDGLTPWGGIVRVGAYGVLARNTTRESQLLRGMDGRRNMHGFAFAGPQELFVLEDVNQYARATVAAASSQLASYGASASDEPGWARASLSGQSAVSGSNQGPLLSRTSLATAVVRWAWAAASATSSTGWREEAGRKTLINDACYSLVVRKEPAGGAGPADRTTAVVYTAGRTKLYRVVPETQVVTVLAQSSGGQHFRGVAIPPSWGPGASPSPSPTLTPSKSRSRTRTRTRKARPAA